MGFVVNLASHSNTFHICFHDKLVLGSKTKCVSNFKTSFPFTFAEASSLPLSSLSLCQFVSLLSLGAGSWILNPCGLLGGGFFFQIAWQCLKHHRQSPKSTQNHTLLFSLLPFSSFSFCSLIYPTPSTHPWLPPRCPSKGFSWIPQHPLHPQQTCIPSKPETSLPKGSLELKLMKFLVVRTPYQIRKAPDEGWSIMNKLVLWKKMMIKSM